MNWTRSALLVSSVLLGACGTDDAGSPNEIPATDTVDGSSDDGSGDSGEPVRVTVTPSSTAQVACTACGGGCRAEHLEYGAAQHVDKAIALDYENVPPAGGSHDPCWAKWGEHTEALASRHWVHNLEHGGVVFLYDCPDGCADDVVTLASMVAPDAGGTALLTPFSGLPRKFAVIAWNERLLADCVDETAFKAFYEANKDKAPESIASGPPEKCL